VSKLEKTIQDNASNLVTVIITTVVCKVTATLILQEQLGHNKTMSLDTLVTLERKNQS
jgi:hypothetical protein